MGRKQKLVFGFALVQILAVGQKSIFKARVDEHLIGLVSQAFELTVRHAESPVLGIIGCSIGDQIRLIRQRVKMLLELGQRDPLSHGHAVAHDVQVRPSKVDNLFAPLILDVGVANVPLARDGPIEDRGPRRHLVHLKLDMRADLAQCLPHAIAGDAAANRIYLGGKGEDFFAYALHV